MFQTGGKVKRLKRIPLVGERLYAWASALCGRLTGHPPGSDWGYGVDGRNDVWCRWCDRFQTIEADEVSPEARAEIYKILGKDVRQPQGETVATAPAK